MPVPKKDEESGYLNSLRHFCKDFPQGRIIPSETPDFIVQTTGYRVGIEITKIFLNDGSRKASAQSVEAARDRITKLAQDFAAEMGAPPVSVTLFFNWTLPLYRRKEEDIARAVALTIDRKRATLPTCLKSCEECWLLVVANSFRASGNIKPDPDSLLHPYDSPFARTYFFDNGLGKLTLLKCAPKLAE